MNHHRNSPTRRTAVALTALALLASTAAASGETSLGSLSCDRIPGTTTNLIITSSADVRCIFKGQGESEQWYVGETGVAIGLDLKWTQSETISFAVLSTTREFTPEGDFLSGDYSGAKADAALGIGGGVAVLIGGSEETTALQPAVTTGEGVGISAGVGFLTLKPDALNVARVATPRGDLFTQALYSTYFGVALDEYRAGRYAQSDHFADKALSAANGQRQAPDRVEGAGLAGEQLAALGDARRRVVAAQNHEFAASVLGETAVVQAYYDCWLNASTAPASAERAADCKEYFDTTMQPLEARLDSLTAAAFREEQLMKPRWFTVYFATDVSTPDETGEAVIDEVVKAFGNYKEARVYVWGHTDRVGSQAYNLKLSNERADNTKAALVRAGLPLEWIRAVGYGKTRPFRVTSNPHDATNRRVNIVLEPLAVKPN